MFPFIEEYSLVIRCLLNNSAIPGVWRGNLHITEQWYLSIALIF